MVSLEKNVCIKQNDIERYPEEFLSSISLKTVENVNNFFEFFRCGGNNTIGREPPFKFVYAARLNTGIEYKPYDIVVVPRDKRPYNYYVITSTSVSHVFQNGDTEIWNIDRYILESKYFSELRGIAFFKNYLKYKMLKRWFENISLLKFINNREKLGKRLLLSKEQFCQTIKQIQKISYDLRLIQWFEDNTGKILTITDRLSNITLKRKCSKLQRGGLNNTSTRSIERKSSKSDLLVQDVPRLIFYPPERPKWGYKWEHFLKDQKEHFMTVKDIILKNIERILKEMRNTSNILAIKAEEIRDYNDEDSMEKELLRISKVSAPKVGVVYKEAVEAEQMEMKQHMKKKLVECDLLQPFIRMIDYSSITSLFLNILYNFFIFSKHLNLPHQNCVKDLKICFQITMIFEGTSPIKFSPSAEELHKNFNDFVDEIVATLSNVPRLPVDVELKKYMYGKHSGSNVAPLDELLKNDSDYNICIQRIHNVIDTDYAEVTEKAKVYEPCRTCLQFFLDEWPAEFKTWPERASRKDLKTILKETEIRAFISKVHKNRTDLSKLSNKICGILALYIDPLTAELKRNLDAIMTNIKTILLQLCTRRVQEVGSQLDAKIALLKLPQLELREFNEWLEHCFEIAESASQLVQQCHDVENLFVIADECNFDFPPMLLDKRERIVSNMDRPGSASLLVQFSAALEEAKKFKIDHNDEIMEQLKNTINETVTTINGVTESLETGEFRDCSNPPQTMLVQLKQVHNNIELLTEKKNVLERYCNNLGADTPKWTELHDCNKVYDKRHLLLSTAIKWEEKRTYWNSTPVEQIDGEVLRDELVEIFQFAHKVNKSDPDSVTQKLLKEVTVEKQNLNIMVDLCNPAIKEEHWKQIFEALKKRPLLPESRTLEALRTIGAYQHQEEIGQISAIATGEYVLVKQLQKISDLWEKQEFILAKNRDQEDVKVLGGLDEIVQMLEEHQIQVQTCMASRHAGGIRPLVEDWDTKLSLIGSVIDAWLNVQKSWIYLEFVFSSDDIKKQLPEESKWFANVNRVYRTLMKSTEMDNNVLRICTEEGLLDRLTEAGEQLDKIQKRLEDYLETKRSAFPRFYFLSNDELLSILSDVRNPTAVQPHMQKCFDNIKELEFDGPITITAMKSTEGEVVPFSQHIKATGNVEHWLNDIERMMRSTLYDLTKEAVEAYPVRKRTEWYFLFPSQCVQCVDQIVWTGEVEDVWARIAEGTKDALVQYLDFYRKQILETVGLVKGELTNLQRTCTCTLIVVDVHNRDVVSSLIDTKCCTCEDFNWQKQLRYYWMEAPGGLQNIDCFIHHSAACFSYGYEYLGNQLRLVITPLTERAFFTCTSALHMFQGAAPQGPAGTGKTESVKDLGKALARQVVVFNCSDGINYRIMSRMFAGLAQAGAWACFDEFNRIEIEVLSVIAQQMLEITTAIAKKQTSMIFDGHKIRLHPNFGVFITMNPGYAGRTELPDNLKALFRPICMMIPDYALIAEIMFFSEGFSDARNLSQKMVRLYSLSSQQLSKQDHYDFGMRAVKSILVMAGALKRAEPENSEDMILIRAMRDANVPKFLRDDTNLFFALINDLFPSVEIKEVCNDALESAVTNALNKNDLQCIPALHEKVMQLYETMVVRHGVMLVGQTMTGKTTCGTTLAQSLTALHEGGTEGVTDSQRRFYQKTTLVTVNPKSITMGELYGDVNRMTREWQDGVLSNIVRELVKDTRKNRYWITFDGPVDAVWIENMNTVLDDNKMLCLVNGERIKLPDTLSIVFEVQDLRVASPATVSRCGMVYLDYYVLEGGWIPVARSKSLAIAKAMGHETVKRMSIVPEDNKSKAAARRKSSFIASPEEALALEAVEEEEQLKEEKRNSHIPKWNHERLMGYLESLIAPLITFLRRNCQEYIKTVDAQIVINVLDLLHSCILTFLNDDDGDDIARMHGFEVPPDSEEFDANRTFDMLFLYCVVWSLGGNVNDNGREAFSTFCREQMKMKLPLAMMPVSGTVYDYFVHKRTQTWKPWSYKVPIFTYDPDAPYFELMVPTTDTVALQQILSSACFAGRHALVNGITGTGKSSAVSNFTANTLQCENAESLYQSFSITFSAQTSSHSFQETITSKLQKRRGEKELGPVPGKKMVAVIDDCNMPQLEIYGASPPIELLRQIIVQGGFYDRKKLNFKEIVSVIFICCCGEPGGGKNEMTQRFTSRFVCICITALSEPSMKTIFNGILGQFLQVNKFAQEVVCLAPNTVDATIAIYNQISKEMLPTPERTHYTFNLRDISKVIQGVLQCDPAHVQTPSDMVDLWCHEASRVFHDRLINMDDRSWWWTTINSLAKKHFNVDLEAESTKEVIYASWADKKGNAYKRVTDMPMLQNMLKDYQTDYNASAMKETSLVLFDDAIAHLARICRVLRQPRGNMLLVGVGGSGRHSLVELASYICSMDCRGIVIAKRYGVTEFRDDVKKVLIECGARGKTTAFLLSDNQLIYSQMLEDVNNLLNIGEVPGMMGAEDFDAILTGCRDGVRASGKPETRNNIYQYFVSHCRDNMHVILCMSPAGEQFRDRLRMFPSLVNCMTIDWYTAWPRDALLSVARQNLATLTLGEGEMNEKVCEAAVYMHVTVDEMNARMLREVRRLNSTTPTSYLSLLDIYKQMYANQLQEIDSNVVRYKNGIDKLASTNETIDVLQQKIKDMQPVLERAAKEADAQKAQLAVDQAEAEKLQAEVSKEEEAARALMQEAQGIKNECEEMLAEALPALEKAEEALNTLQAKDIQEIKVFTSPPQNVAKTLDAVLILLGKKEGWQSAKLELSNMQFLKNLQDYDKDSISLGIIKKLQRFVKDPEFIPEVIEKTSLACKSLCMWALAMDKYYWVAKDVAPKKEMFMAAQAKVEAAEKELAIKQSAVAKIIARVNELVRASEETAQRKANLEAQITEAEAKLGRADQLINGLSSENQRWHSNLGELAEERIKVVGTMCLAAGAVAYLGPFTAGYRQDLFHSWTAKCQELGIPIEPSFTLEKLVGSYTIREWNIHGLPLDPFSIENGAILKWSTRWCLMIDPQGQANQFVRKREAKNKIRVIKLSDENYMRVLESAIQIGLPVLLENVGEDLDAALDPILLKQTVSLSGRTVLRLGDKEVDYDPNFRIYITTKLPNPRFTPELQIKVNTINFTVTRKGLEDQLLSAIVASERADLQEKSDQCVVAIAKGMSDIKGLENTILRMLAESTGDILDNVELINTLSESKKTADAIAKDLIIVEKTNEEIQLARERYRSLATRGSLLYKVIADLANVDPMYQYSLVFFKKLFITTLGKTKDNDTAAPPPEVELTAEEQEAEDQRLEQRRKDPSVADARVQILIPAVSWAAYSVICRGLFEKDKLLFSFMLTIAFRMHDETFKPSEWDSFLRGGSGVKIPDTFPKKPNWIEPPVWLDACALSMHQPVFKGLEQVIATDPNWRQWISDPHVHETPPPAPHAEISAWHRALLVKTLRPEKLVEVMVNVVKEYLALEYTVSPQFSLREAFEDSNCMTPLIFVLSTGTDPTAMFTQFADEMGYGERKLMLSLGQDQGRRAEEMITEGKKDGLWVYLQNCHVYVSWMPALEAIVEQMRPEEIHPDFRLWLTSSPSKFFPVPVLQSGMKLTKEPPKGLKANLKDFFCTLDNSVWEEYTPIVAPPAEETEGGDAEPMVVEIPPNAKEHERSWKRLLFSLAFFHAIVQERRKFGALGWNIAYEWNAPDCQASIKTLRIAMEQPDNLPWTAIRYILGVINYGGRVTDFLDQRCLATLCAEFFDESMMESGPLLFDPRGRYSFDSDQVTTREDTLALIETLPAEEGPELFGLNRNAEISYQSKEAHNLTKQLIDIQPSGVGSAGEGGKSEDEIIYELCDDLLDRLPALIDREKGCEESFKVTEKGTMISLGTVLSQEIDQFNNLLKVTRNSLVLLKRAIKGEVVMSAEMESMYANLSFNLVPENWKKVGYLCLKPLFSYYIDLIARIEFIAGWCYNGFPRSYWVSGLFFPQGFITGVFQTHARSYNIPIDRIKFRFNPVPNVLRRLSTAAAGNTGAEGVPLPHVSSGVYCHGFFLDGASWENNMLAEGKPGLLFDSMPPIHFEPVTLDEPDPPGIYECPLYKASTRAGILSTTGLSTNFVLSLQLPSPPDKKIEHWIKCGVAALCMLDY